MDLPIILSRLGVLDGDMLPASDLSDYAAMVASWRNPAVAIPTLAVCEAEQAVYAAEVQAVAYKAARLPGYPPKGDQLDVLWKQLNQDRLDGKALIQEADDMLGGILANKAANPKPGA